MNKSLGKFTFKNGLGKEFEGEVFLHEEKLYQFATKALQNWSRNPLNNTATAAFGAFEIAISYKANP